MNTIIYLLDQNHYTQQPTTCAECVRVDWDGEGRVSAYTSSTVVSLERWDHRLDVNDEILCKRKTIKREEGKGEMRGRGVVLRSFEQRGLMPQPPHGKISLMF